MDVIDDYFDYFEEPKIPLIACTLAFTTLCLLYFSPFIQLHAINYAKDYIFAWSRNYACKYAFVNAWRYWWNSKPKSKELELVELEEFDDWDISITI